MSPPRFLERSAAGAPEPPGLHRDRYFAPTECLSASGDVDRSARCEVMLEGSELRVHSEAAYTHEYEAGSTDDCGGITASCKTPSLAAGQYDLVHGDDRFSFEIPAAPEQAPCTRPPPPPYNF